ncbi:hypothetical protein GQ55_9G190300 [Panicum hallii var. hallii]|uniref:Uncharacterized protein n=2 Tax=Panicum hallii TaxID=206008 RepID=A0A2T7C4W0_9POAL|nr:hypothetical protein GQ55_9G190300 [Panicum hallii var. hallii]PVH31625.1 hypothetical protein PAHAL_9G194200 [Panicum hallii]
MGGAWPSAAGAGRSAAERGRRGKPVQGGARQPELLHHPSSGWLSGERGRRGWSTRSGLGRAAAAGRRGWRGGGRRGRVERCGRRRCGLTRLGGTRPPRVMRRGAEPGCRRPARVLVLRQKKKGTVMWDIQIFGKTYYS